MKRFFIILFLKVTSGVILVVLNDKGSVFFNLENLKAKNIDESQHNTWDR